MTYQETVNYLFNATPVFEKIGAAAYKEGLYNSLTLDEHFGHPHRNYPIIHVAGTNGKGSCSHTLAAILQEEGYKVGLYTSPHLIDFRERIRINGICIDQNSVIDFVAKEKDFFEPLYPSFFELTTAMAFKYFAEQKVDIAVVEVGLGGRLDCTNIITPILSIITNISLDHTQFLGNTLPAIAAEKAGIIKPGIPVVIGETTPETKPVFAEKASRCQAPIIYAEDAREVESSRFDRFHQQRIYKTKSFGTIRGDLTGSYQNRNTNTILTAAKILMQNGTIEHADSIRTGFQHVSAKTGLLGRWQQLGNQPTVICDTGHNVGGWKYLSEQLKRQHCRQMRIVFGMVDDKDITAVIKLLPKDATYYWTQPSSKRAFPVETIAQIGAAHQRVGKIYNNVVEAYRSALDEADRKDFIFIGGSTYVVADLLGHIR